MRSTFLNMYWALPCMLLLAGCANETSLDEESKEQVELQINPIVATTRSAIQDAAAMGTVAVYATGTDYADDNNYAVYTKSGETWSSGPEKIFLTNEKATINAYYPSDAVRTTTSIPIKLLESADIAAKDNAAADSKLIASATEEVDCMWATPIIGVTNKSGNKVTLNMNHALSMVSFRVYKNASYKGAGSLTKFVVANVDAGTTLNKGTNPTMDITTGVITAGAVSAATYTRTITDGYTLLATGEASKKFSVLVLPIDASIGNEKIKATFTIDGVDYSVNLTAPTDNAGKWLAGKNHLYTVELSGTELAINTVTVTEWVTVTSGNLGIQ